MVIVTLELSFANTLNFWHLNIKDYTYIKIEISCGTDSIVLYIKFVVSRQ